MLKLADLASYVAGAVPNGTTTVPVPTGDTLIAVNRIPDVTVSVPMVMVAIAHGGRGFLTDGAFQEVVIHTRSRWSTDEGAETLALAVDAAMLNSLPLLLGSATVRNAYPAGGPPAFFERDVTNNTVYFCDYILEVSR